MCKEQVIPEHVIRHYKPLMQESELQTRKRYKSKKYWSIYTSKHLRVSRGTRGGVVVFKHPMKYRNIKNNNGFYWHRPVTISDIVKKSVKEEENERQSVSA